MEGWKEIGFIIHIIYCSLGNSFKKWVDRGDIVKNNKEDGTDFIWDFLIVENYFQVEWKWFKQGIIRVKEIIRICKLERIIEG